MLFTYDVNILVEGEKNILHFIVYRRTKPEEPRSLLFCLKKGENEQRNSIFGETDNFILAQVYISASFWCNCQFTQVRVKHNI